MRLLIVTLAISLLATACGDPPKPGPLEDLTGNSRVIMVNEGNFQWGNASLSVYLPKDKKIINNAFESANGFPLGDVAQSITRYKDRLYVVINNSGKVLVLDTAELKVQSEWSGFDSPRYVEHINDQFALVSDLYHNGVYVVDKEKGSIVKEININGWTDKMITVGDHILVTNRDGSALYRIRKSDQTLEDSMVLSPQPQAMVQDADGKLWVLCSGVLGTKKGMIWRIDPETGESLFNQELNVAAFVNHMDIDKDGRSLFYVEQDLYKMSIEDTILPSEPWYDLNMTAPYAMRVDKESGDVYVADGKDFLSKCRLIRIDVDAKKIDEFETGILTGDLLFID